MTYIFERLKSLVLSVRLFSAVVVQLSLYQYQAVCVDSVLDSCLNNRGLEFLWIFPRQSGKDEAIAQMCAFLLALFHRADAGLVHVYPTGGQLATGITRLEHRLENAWSGGRWWRKSKPDRRGLGKAQVAFFSGHPLARSEGATANLLLIVNETQDQNEGTIERRFTPMRASSNATALYVGTVRTTDDYLWKVKQRLEKEQLADGFPRVFMVDPYMVGAENPHYLEFVERQIELKGRQHPAVRTEFFNEPVDVAAGLFPPRRRDLMRGYHARLSGPQAGESYLALVDVGGQDEAATEAYGQELDNPNRDYTVCTVVRVRRDDQIKVGPVYEVVDVFVDHGSRHFQSAVGQPALFDRLMAVLVRWSVVAVICDSTGVGQGLTDALIEAYKRTVIGFDFSKAYGKARLGSDFLAVVETGRFRYFIDDVDVEGSDSWWFFTQAEHCSYELAESLPIERGLRWGVSPAAKVILSDGGSELIHDDRLLSAALIAEADRLVRAGDLFMVTGDSAVIDQGHAEDVGEWS